jgi:hypothetical protein
MIEILVHLVQTTPAGWCYQCNSKNPLCGNKVDPSQKSQMTPCNGQCYTYSYKNGKYETDIPVLFV